MKSKLLANVTPGEILEEDFLKPMGLSQYRLAKDIGVSARRINEIIKGERTITADTALRLGRFFNMSAQFWLNLQSAYDFLVAGHSTSRPTDWVATQEARCPHWGRPRGSCEAQRNSRLLLPVRGGSPGC